MAALLILLLLLALYFLQGFLYDRLWDRGLQVEISFQEEYAVEDDTSRLVEVVTNDKLLPLPVVEIDFHMDRGLRFSDEANTSVSDRSYRRDVFALGPRQRITRTLEFRCAHRGYYRIDQAGMDVRSLLLTKKYVSSTPESTDFYVLPRPVETQRVQIPFSQLMGSAFSRKKVYDDPFEFAGLRGYVRGDPMKYINWKATARTGQLLVNLHESTLSQKVVLVLDMEGLGIQQADVLNEEAVRIACSLGVRLLQAGVKLSVYSNGLDAITQKPMALPELSGPGSVLSLQKALACVQAQNGLESVVSFLPGAASQAGENDLLCVLISREQGEPLAQAFAQRAGRREWLQITPYRGDVQEMPGMGSVRRLYWES
ncbi:MAG: DUF58 domain-containing protein [Acutalibacter sp.]|jgi:uncharacterized protein (DUF58 family)